MLYLLYCLFEEYFYLGQVISKYLKKKFDSAFNQLYFLFNKGVGIAYYLSPRLEKLTEPQVWTDAAIQVFFSIGIGFGAHLTYASFNKFENNCYR